MNLSEAIKKATSVAFFIASLKGACANWLFDRRDLNLLGQFELCL